LPRSDAEKENKGPGPPFRKCNDRDSLSLEINARIVGLNKKQIGNHCIEDLIVFFMLAGFFFFKKKKGV
jgi:hypothetical protein